jgi:predicted AlkP superfamily phosphohydrolase/phosphomutase
MKPDRILIALIVVVVVVAAILAILKTRTPATTAPEAASDAGGFSLLVIGISGFEESVFDRLSEDGRLPNMTAMAREGAVAHFSALPRGTDPRIAWTSLVTGMKPENQGVGGKTMSPRGDLVDAPLVPASRTVNTIWTILNDQGERCALLGWPGTWPAEEVDGVVVVPHSNYVLERKHGGAVEELVYPPSVHTVLDPMMIDPDDVSRKELARFVDLDSTMGLEALIGQNYAALSQAYAGDIAVRDVAEFAAGNLGIRNAFVYLGGTDIASQRFWHYMDTEAFSRVDLSEEDRRLLEGQVAALSGAVDAYYEFVDELVGDLIALAADDATVAIVTDHGYIGVPLDASGLPRVGPHMHSERGLWMIEGPNVVSGARADGTELTDVAPTIMAAAGIPPRGDLDGEVLDELIER